MDGGQVVVDAGLLGSWASARRSNGGAVTDVAMATSATTV